MVAAVVLVGGSGAGTTNTRGAVRVDVSTRSAVIHYLRSIHVNPRGVVIQRGAHNYAGPNCPGKRWTCANTLHTVVQVGGPGAKNVFRCKTAHCSVLQISKGALAATNTAKCIKTTGVTQSCSINQSSTSSNNQAIVVEIVNKTSGLTQSASLGATITQRAGSGANTACVFQTTLIDGSTVAKKGVPVNVNLEAHQTISITQDSTSGNNTVGNATTAGGCDSGSALTQSQELKSTATGTAAITQNQNAANGGPNLTLDIKQNQSSGFFGSATGLNNATFTQTNNLTAVANTPAGPVNQTQSSANGGIFAAVNQDSRGKSTAVAIQNETECEDAHASGTTAACHTTQDPPTYSLTQTQFGPLRKAPGDSSQTGNETAGTNSFTVTQHSTQNSDTTNHQKNVVEGGFTTSGNGTVNQTTSVDGQSTSNTQTGQNTNSSINCSGSSCVATPTITSAPPDPSDSSTAVFAFSDSNATATFLCDIDGGGYSSCTSPKTYTGLENGSHTFSVKATDGTVVSNPATYTWTVDAAPPPTFTWDGSQLNAQNVDMKEFGVGGMRGGDGSGTVTVSGLSGPVAKAYLYWNGPTNSSDPAANADVTFAGTPVTGTNIGIDSDNNWGFANSQSYRADVTSLVSGNGSYSLAAFVKAGVDMNGVALVVFTAGDRNVVLWNGNDSNCDFGPSYAATTWDETISGVPYPGSGSASLDFVVGDGQTFTDGTLAVNTTTIASGSIFDGATGAASDSLWDVKSIDLTAALTTGSNDLHLTDTGTNDCLSLVVAAANVPASAPIITGPAVTALRSTSPPASAVAPSAVASGPGTPK
jgi:hypothetical protein